MRWAGNVARLGAIRIHIILLWGKVKGRENLEDLDVDGNIRMDFGK
jgi:hypothetical protein